MDYYVRIVHDKTGKVEKEMGPYPERKAQRIADGASINLDHENYSVELLNADERARKVEKEEKSGKDQ